MTGVRGVWLTRAEVAAICDVREAACLPLEEGIELVGGEPALRDHAFQELASIGKGLAAHVERHYPPPPANLCGPLLMVSAGPNVGEAGSLEDATDIPRGEGRAAASHLRHWDEGHSRRIRVRASPTLDLPSCERVNRTQPGVVETIAEGGGSVQEVDPLPGLRVLQGGLQVSADRFPETLHRLLGVLSRGPKVEVDAAGQPPSRLLGIRAREAPKSQIRGPYHRDEPFFSHGLLPHPLSTAQLSPHLPPRQAALAAPLWSYRNRRG